MAAIGTLVSPPAVKTVIRWFSILLVFAGIGLGVRHYLRARKPVPPRYSTVAVDRGRIAAHVTATGILSALVTVQVGTQVSGRIESIKVDFNSVVKKGQVVATIEASLFQAAVEQARANYSAAKAAADKARAQEVDADRQYTRAKTLSEQKLIAQADIDTAEANYAIAKAGVAAADAGVEQAEASLHQAQVSLKYTTIVSPIDGIVISRSIDVGQTVAASLSAPTLFTIAQDLTKMQVDTSVAEGDVGKIQPDMPVTFMVDAYPGQRFHGSVRQVRDAATTVQNVVTYDAVIDVDNSKRLLKPGMTATVTFTPAERDDALRVPNAALRYHPAPAASAKNKPEQRMNHFSRNRDRDKRTVYVFRGTTVTPVELRVGITDGSMTEVLSGDLNVGDELVTDELDDVKTGSTSPPGSTSHRGIF